MDEAIHMRALLIINPVSGPARRGRGADRFQLATSTLEKLGVPAEIRLTERGGHAHDLAREAVAAAIDLVIAWGGDGTINEIGRALVRSGTALGIVPGGSGNGLARDLGIPFDPAKALERAFRLPTRAIDAGELGGRLFFNVAGIGLDAHVAVVVATRLNHRGLLPYVMASGRDLLRYLPVEYSIEADSQQFRSTAVVVAMANSRQYGFGARIAPHAMLDDGLLDLVIVEDRKLIGNLARLPFLFAGTVDRRTGVTVSKVRTISVRSRIPMLFHVDGEACDGGLELVARVHAGVLRIRA
jgi:YegS/Rv2252/BmrU family lipid kinase